MLNHGGRFQIKGAFSKVLRRQKFKPILYLFIPFLIIVVIRYDEATFAALIKGGCIFAVFLLLRFFCSLCTFCLSVSCSGKPPLQVYNFTLRRFRVFLLHYLINYCLFLCYILSFAGVFISLLRCKGNKNINTLQTFYQKSLYFYLSLTRNE